MAFPARSNTLQSKYHPLMDDIEVNLCRLKYSEAASVSSSSICSKLDTLRDLQDDTKNLIELPSIQQALSHQSRASELLDGSLQLVDFCGVARDIISLTKESVQELESSLRRNKDANTYMASRKKIIKMVKKCIKNLKASGQCSEKYVNEDAQYIVDLLNDSEAIGLSVLQSVVLLVSGEKERSKKSNWSLVSKFTKSKSRVHSLDDAEFSALNIDLSSNGIVNAVLKQLKESKLIIQELEEGLELFFRSLIKTRVSLLNVLNH